MTSYVDKLYTVSLSGVLYTAWSRAAFLVAVMFIIELLSATEIFFLRFLGAFAKLRRVTSSSCLSAWKNSASTGRILMKFGI